VAGSGVCFGGLATNEKVLGTNDITSRHDEDISNKLRTRSDRTFRSVSSQGEAALSPNMSRCRSSRGRFNSRARRMRQRFLKNIERSHRDID
jgi:hypothetical protein